MSVLQALEHVKLVVHHLLVALDVLLQDNLDSHLALWAVGFSDNAIGACAECTTEPVFGSASHLSDNATRRVQEGVGYELLVVTLGLAM